MKMLKRFYTLLAVLLAVCVPFSLCAEASGEPSDEQAGIVAEENAENFGSLLTHLAAACEEPSEDHDAAIEADLAAIEAVGEEDYILARSISDNWRGVFLDPDYTLYLYHGDDAAPELADAGIPNSAGHAIVVLGYELKDGQMQPELIGRCEAAAAAAKAFPETIVVCSGGATGKNNTEGNTEAGLMKAYLTEKCGIDAARIFIDENAMTTAENAVNTFRILQENDVHSMTIVTSDYHMRRGQVLYHVLAELYRQQQDYAIESVANYCFDTGADITPENAGARIAATQIAGILELPSSVTQALRSSKPASAEAGGGSN